MHLEDAIDGVMYSDKLDEINGKLAKLEAEKDWLEGLHLDEVAQKRRIANLRKIVEEGVILDEFDRYVFESIIEKIIIGGTGEDGQNDPEMITFVYKTGFVDYHDGGLHKPKRKARSKSSASDLSRNTRDDSKALHLHTSHDTCGVRRAAVERKGEGMNGITIERAREADIPAIEGILLDAVRWLDELGQSLWYAEDMAWDRLSQAYPLDSFYIARIDGIPAGCMSLIDHDPAFWPDVAKGEALFLHKLAVTEAARKSGVADSLIDFAKEECVKRRIAALRLDCDAMRPKQRAVYERHGFVRVGERAIRVKRVQRLAMYVWQSGAQPVAIP